MKKITSMVLLLLCACLLTACGCKHEWMDATCEAPKTCTLCGETEGEALPHVWNEATCVNPKFCQNCGIAEGEQPAGHQWQDLENHCSQICSVCGAIGGEVKEHLWQEATCTQPKTCTACGITEGECAPHTDLAAMDTSGDLVQITCTCGVEEEISDQDLMMRMLQGNWTMMAVYSDGGFYAPEPSYDWEEGSWMEIHSSEEPLAYQGFISDAGIYCVAPFELSDFQAGSYQYRRNGNALPIVQCIALAGTPQQETWQLVLGPRGYDPADLTTEQFLNAAHDGYVTCLWRYTEKAIYLYGYNPGFVPGVPAE